MNVLTCSACKRVVLEKNVLRSIRIGVHVVDEVEYRKRPYAAVVHTRKRTTGKVRMPDGAEVEITDYALICSRACLDAIRANEEYKFTAQESASVRLGASPPPNIKDGDDYLATAIGSSGPMPDEPSDEWIVVSQS